MLHGMKRMIGLAVLLWAGGGTAQAQAQFGYSINADDSVTITNYTGSGGDVVIPATIDGMPVRVIGDQAFQESGGLTSVTVSNGIASIGNYAFEFCPNLVSVTIPASVTNIGVEAFTEGSSLTAITVNPQNPYYSSVNGILFDKNQTLLVAYPGGLSGSYTIPESVSNLAESAFAVCARLTSVTIDSNITVITDNAFAQCYNLTNVTIPGSVTSIGNDAFQLSGLSAIAIPNSVTNIGAEAFEYCGLTNLTIPGSVTSLGDAAFELCNSLTNVTMEVGLTSIGNSAFAFSGLTDVTIPGGVTSIGPSAFDNCLNLASAVIPGSATNIGADAFVACPSLAKVTIGNGVTRLSDYMFYGSALTGVVIPPSVNSIGNGVFEFCGSLTNAALPDSVTNIGAGAFQYCGSLSNLTIPAHLTSLGDYAFSDCSSLGSAAIPGSVGNIGSGAFASCVNLATVAIGNGVTNIADSAFFDCTSLTSVTLPASLLNLDVTAFGDCTGLTAINVDGQNPVYSSQDGVLYDKNATTLVEFPGGVGGSFTIAEGVTSIGDEAFYNLGNVTSVTIPGSVTNIGNSAFSFSGLASVTIPSSVANLGSDAFANCINLTSVTILGGSPSFGDGVFYNCPSLASVTIGDGVTSIGSDMFNSCVSLTALTLPASVTNIGDFAFFNCTGLSGVYFQGNAPLTGVDSFGNDYGPTGYYLPGNVGAGSAIPGLSPTSQGNPKPLVITEPLSQTVLPGENVTLQAGAFGPGALSYQWRFDGAKLANSRKISGATNQALKLKGATPVNAGSYTVVISNSYGAVTSRVAVVTLLAITKQPANRATSPGGLAAFSVKATGAPLSYRWYFDGTPLLNDGNISGSGSNRMTINFAASNNVGRYSVVVGCPSGYVTSRVAQLNLSMETNQPAVAITSPRGGSRTPAPVLSGTARDPVRVQSVAYWITNLNNGVQTTFNGQAALTTGRGAVSNWTIQIALLPGTNILAVQSSNYAGLASPVASTTFFYQEGAPLQLTGNPPGSGTVTGIGASRRTFVITNGTALNVGETYTLTAKPAASWWFTNWLTNGALAGANASLSFIMESNLAVTADFVTNLIVGKAARYDGIFYPSNPPGVTEATAGLIENLRVSVSGVYSGKLFLAGTNYELTGTFNHAGDAMETIHRSAATGGNLTLRLNIPWQSEPRQITGSLQGTNLGGWTSSNLSLYAATTNTNNSPAYTALLTLNLGRFPGDASTNYGYAVITNTGSMINMGGVLPDGTAFSRSEPVNEWNEFPVYASIDDHKGVLLGKISLSAPPHFPPAGRSLFWIKPASSSGPYANGFSSGIAVTASPWTNSVQALTNLFQGHAQLTISGGGLTSNIVCGVRLSNSNRLTLHSSSPRFVGGSINRANGLLTVAFINDRGEKVTAAGAVLQNRDFGGGFFLGATDAGTITLTGQSP